MTSSTLEDRHQQQGETQQRNVVFVISPFEEDHSFLSHVFEGSTWMPSGAFLCRDALEVLPAERTAVVICDSELPDGDWKEILEALVLQPHPPPLVVTSRLADERLWAEVLHLDGSDVLAKPLDRREVLWAVNSAWQQWDHHRRREPITRVRQAAASTGQ